MEVKGQWESLRGRRERPGAQWGAGTGERECPEWGLASKVVGGGQGCGGFGTGLRLKGGGHNVGKDRSRSGLDSAQIKMRDKVAIAKKIPLQPGENEWREKD
eukprot:690169-Rhodomonas_salina.1